METGFLFSAKPLKPCIIIIYILFAAARRRQTLAGESAKQLTLNLSKLCLRQSPTRQPPTSAI
jgi:hypothetical protein